jgi:hypothetical protein
VEVHDYAEEENGEHQSKHSEKEKRFAEENAVEDEEKIDSEEKTARIGKKTTS